LATLYGGRRSPSAYQPHRRRRRRFSRHSGLGLLQLRRAVITVAFTVYGRRRLTCARARQIVRYFLFHPLLLLLLFFSSNTCPTENQRRRQVSVCARSPPVPVSDRPTLTSLAVSRPSVCTCLYMRVFECACVLLNQLPCSRYRSAAVAVDLFVFARSRSRLTPSPSPSVHHSYIIFDSRAPVRRWCRTPEARKIRRRLGRRRRCR